MSDWSSFLIKKVASLREDTKNKSSKRRINNSLILSSPLKTIHSKKRSRSFAGRGLSRKSSLLNWNEYSKRANRYTNSVSSFRKKKKKIPISEDSKPNSLEEKQEKLHLLGTTKTSKKLKRRRQLRRLRLNSSLRKSSTLRELFAISRRQDQYYRKLNPPSDSTLTHDQSEPDSTTSYFSALSSRWKRWCKTAIAADGAGSSGSSTSTAGGKTQKRRTKVTTTKDNKLSRWLLASKVEISKVSHIASWHLVSGTNAVGEYGVNFCRRLSPAEGARSVWDKWSQMADGKFEAIKRSISSWSLSTIKKPKISAPKFKKSKLNIFSKKKNRLEPKEKEESKETSSIGSSVFIHNDDILSAIQLANNDYNDSSSSTRESTGGEKEDDGLDTTNEENVDAKQLKEPETHLSVLESNDIQFIDDLSSPEIYDTKNETPLKKSEDAPVPKIITDSHFPDKSDLSTVDSEATYDWWDANGTLTRSNRGGKNLEDDYETSNNFYDANDSPSQTLTPGSPGRSYEDILLATNEEGEILSEKARDWVKNFNEESYEKDEPESLNESVEKDEIARCRSDLELNKRPKNWRKKDEIILNTKDSTEKHKIFHLFSKRTKANVTDSDLKEKINRDSIKKIFGIRQKLSLKGPIIDGKMSLPYKEADISLASKPLALSSTACSNSIESLQFSENCNFDKSIDIDTKSVGGHSLDETELLVQEIEKYLNDTDLMKTTVSKQNSLKAEKVDQKDFPGKSSNESNESADRLKMDEVLQDSSPILFNNTAKSAVINPETVTSQETIDDVKENEENLDKSDDSMNEKNVSKLHKPLSKVFKNIKENLFSKDIKEKTKNIGHFRLKGRHKVSPERTDDPQHNEEPKHNAKEEPNSDRLSLSCSTNDGTIMATKELELETPIQTFTNETLTNEQLDHTETSIQNCQNNTLSDNLKDIDACYGTSSPYSKVNKTDDTVNNTAPIDNETKSHEINNHCDVSAEVNPNSNDNTDYSSQHYFEKGSTEIILPVIKLDDRILVSSDATLERNLKSSAFYEVEQVKESSPLKKEAGVEIDLVVKEDIPPKPTPRTKKSKYGYQKLQPSTKTTQDNEGEGQISNKCSEEGSDEINEPIYWEIPAQQTLQPRPKPRKKKDIKETSMRDLREINTSQEVQMKRRSAEIITRNGSSEIPDWINQRPPLPNPRNKKHKSEFSVNGTKIKTKNSLFTLFSSSLSNLFFDDEKSTVQKSDENFYNGKAASVAYGMTSNTNKNNPPLPSRTKKSSISSMQCIIPAEEKTVGQDRCLQENKSGAKAFTPRNDRTKTEPRSLPQIPPQRYINAHSPIQVLSNDLHHFIEILSLVAVGDTIEKKTEDFLSDLLFSIHSLMGQGPNRTWAVPVKDDKNVGEMKNVSLGQVHSYLKEVFQITPEKMEQILTEVKQRKVADFSLKINVIEAKDLRAKTVKGASNPYVIISLNNSDQSHRTIIKHETLHPVWKQEFSLSVSDLNKDVVTLEVWHDFDPKASIHVSQIKNLDGLSRLFKGKNAIVHNQTEILLGSVDIAVKDIKECGINEWFSLHKENPKEGKKMRGSLHIAADMSASLSENFTHINKRMHFDALLTRMIYHNIKTVSNNNNKEEDFVSMPWSGQLCTEAKAILSQHSIVFGLNASHQHLSWWIACSKVPTIDTGLQLILIQKVHKSFTEQLFDASDIESLADSLYSWTKYSAHKLRHLKVSFPPSSGIIAKAQFTDLIRIFGYIDSNADLKELLKEKEALEVRSQVNLAVTEFVKNWWTNLVEEQLRGVTQPEEQIQRIITISAECLSLLNEISIFYGPALLKELNIPFFREVYLLLTNKINPCVRPSLMNIYSHLSDFDLSDESQKDSDITYTLEDGSLLWQLYVNLGRMTKLGESLPLEIRQGSGINDYYTWFNKSVRRWVDMGRKRTLTMIRKAVELDNLEPVDEYCNFSSSATDAIDIFTSVQIWWKNLAWPDLENSMVLLAKILEDICCYSMTYSDLLIAKVENMLSRQANIHQLVLSKQICTGLNNIQRVRNELKGLKDLFGVDKLNEKVEESSSLGPDVARRFIVNVDTLIDSAAEDMEAKVSEFIEAVIGKMNGTLHYAVAQACEASSEKPLLVEVLDPALQVIHGNMTECNFQRFLLRLWEVIIDHLHNIVVKATDRRKCSFFNGAYQILLASFKFFAPSEGVGLAKSELETEKYKNLLELLECLRLSSENLICRYYSDRHNEQESCVSETPEFVLRAYFTRIGKLTIEVIMAKDLHLHHHDSASPKSPQQQNPLFDPYIKVQLVPQAWFPNLHEVRTKTLRKCEPAVFEESFDFDLKKEDNGVSQGFLLLTLKNYNLGRTNFFMGEALIPLNQIPCVDSGEVHLVPNSYVKVTSPSIEFGHSAISALKLRTGDKVALNFLKKIFTRRQSESKLSIPEDDKLNLRSPRLLQKMRFGT